MGIGQRQVFPVVPDYEALPIQPEPEPKTREARKTDDNDDPRDLTVYNPFLRPVNGEEKAWSNSLRATRESGRRNDDVLEALRKLRAELPVSIAAPNFRDCTYIGQNSKVLPMIEFSRMF
jgi:hypothetical protein